MLIHFYIKYTSKYGESLHIHFRGENGSDSGISFPLNYLNEEYWDLQIQSAALPNESRIIYTVICRLQDGWSKEIVQNRNTDLKKVKPDVLEIFDGPEEIELFDKVFNTTALSRIIKNQKQKTKKHSDKDPNIIFKVHVPPLADGKIICITGSSKKLHEWNEHKPIHLSKKDKTWTVKLNISKEHFPVEFKFAEYDTNEKKIIHFEEGANRILRASPAKGVVSIYNCFPKIVLEKWKGTGLNIPVSAIKTEQTWGIGSFTALHLLIDFARKSGIRLVQLLPLNDTSATRTNKDSYPYASISAFALHPIYMNVQKLATAFGVELSIETMEKIHELNELPQLDYEEVLKLKMSTIQQLYGLEKQSFKDDFAWFEFFDLNRHWLVPYAAFCYLRDKYSTADMRKWEAFREYNEDSIQELVSPENEHYDAIALYYFIQYHLHLQLKDATEHAHKNDVILKGDLPIGVGRFSVDTWMYPHLFHLDMQAGAPPDAFSTKGQNWNFPTYNWEAMAKDNYSWWRRRMEHMENYFDAVRIDHVLGFYRIWSIPLTCKEGILGKFEPAIPLPKSDFEEAGLAFDADRYCLPYITDSMLEKMFAERADWVKDSFMHAGILKEGFDTQRGIDAWFKENPLNEDLQNELFGIISNVILLKDEKNEDKFHFRINMSQTSSYKELPYDQKLKLDQLYRKYFFEIQNSLWESKGRERLTALQGFTKMLLCAEDLGMVPDMVEGMLARMQILSLQVQRMPKNSPENFSHPKNASYLSVVMPSTHDMSTIREWWEDEKEHIQYFYNYLLGQAGEAPFYCEPWICRDIILQHLQSPAMWSIFLMQDLLSISENLRREDPKDERINNPSNADQIWNYRMHITMEELLREKDFISGIKKMVRDNSR